MSDCWRQENVPVFALGHRRFLIGSLRMSEKRGILEGFGFKKSRLIDHGRL